jgi:hypothetical protein
MLLGASMCAFIMTPALSRISPWNSPGPPASFPAFFVARRARPDDEFSASVRRREIRSKWLAR